MIPPRPAITSVAEQLYPLDMAKRIKLKYGSLVGAQDCRALSSDPRVLTFRSVCGVRKRVELNSNVLSNLLDHFKSLHNLPVLSRFDIYIFFFLHYRDKKLPARNNPKIQQSHNLPLTVNPASYIYDRIL